MSTPTSRDRLILYSYGRWNVCELLFDTDDAIKREKSRRYGCSAFTVGDDPREFWLQTTPRGIELQIDPPREDHPEPVEILTWTTVRAIAAEIPAVVKTRLRDHRRRSAQHQADYPMFKASKAAQGCGNPWMWVRPLTEAQALYEAEYEAYTTGLLAAWRAKREWLDEECELLLREALLAEHEPADLLELLAAGGTS